MWLLMLVAIIAVSTAYILWKRRYCYQLSWQLPGPFAPPILGNSLKLTNIENLLIYLEELTSKYGSPIRLWLGPQLIVFISDAENMEIILKSKDCLNKPEFFYQNVREGLKVDGLITSNVTKWKMHRRFVSPLVNSQSLQAYFPAFNKRIKTTVASLPSTEEFFDILPNVLNCTVEMFIQAVLGSEIEPIAKQKYMRMFTEALELVTKRSVNPLFKINFIWNLTYSGKYLEELIQSGYDTLLKILKKKVQSGSSDSHTFLERLLNISNVNPNFTYDDIITETTTILSAATDSIATTTAFLTLMLALYPEHQENVYQEILTVMPNKDTEITSSDLNKLELTDLCIRETLRLYPAIPLIGRKATKSITLNNGVEIPPNVTIVCGIHTTQIQEKYYGPTAKIFNPYRFSDDQVKNLPSCAYMPFSYGPRNCFGNFYALLSVKCFIVHLVRSYRITTSYKHIDELLPVMSIVLHLRDKHMVKLERRT